MSKRFQQGSVKIVGDRWKGRYRQDVPGEAGRKQPQVDLGARSEMTRTEARRKIAEIIDGLGLNKSSYVEKLEVPAAPAVTFNHVCDAWEKKRLPELALSTQNSAPKEIAKHLRPFLGELPLEKIKTGILNDWIKVMEKFPLEPKTVENKYKYFTQIMNWHYEQLDEPKRTWNPKLPPVSESQARWYTPMEMIKIIDTSVEYPAHGQVKGQYQPLFRLDVSAGAKIPIVPIEFSPPLDVVNRDALQMEEVPKLVKGERRARTQRTATARDEHPGDQRADRLGPQDHSQVCAGGGGGARVWPTASATEQARCV